MANKTPSQKKTVHCDTLVPAIIPRPEHTISRKNLDREALKVMHRLRDAGFKAYLVGGGVRDILLGKAPKDFDISTDARPGQVRKLFRNSRIIGRRFRLVQVFFSGNKIVEVSTFRQSSEFAYDDTDQVLKANNTFGTPCEDAFRRDLTINAMFYEIENLTVIDYTGGVEDLQKGIVRLVGDPFLRVVRDPVRIMRVVRHATRINFTIEQETWAAIRQNLDKLELCPSSRIRDELFKDLFGGASSSWVQLAIDSGLFCVLFPFYTKLLTQEAEVTGAIKDELVALCEVVDRLGKEGRVVPPSILFVLLLLPWGERCMDFESVGTLKSSYELSKRTREVLATFFVKLNIKKGMQDSIARCFATIPLLRKHDKGGSEKGWPKWLRRKSYFADGQLLYKLSQEAKGNGKADDLSGLASTTDSIKKEPRIRRDKSSGRGPAFAKSTKGGVFGFRRW